MARRAVSLALAIVALSALPAEGASLASEVFGTATVSALTITLSGVQAGDRVLVFVVQTASAARTYTVADSEGVGNSYASVVNQNCGTARCAQAFADDVIAAGDGTLAITVNQSSSFNAYAAWAVAVRCPSASCVTDASSSATQATVTTHYAAPAGSIDTLANTMAISACAGDATFGTETVKAGWTALGEASGANAQAMGQYIASAAALTDERSEMTSSNARSSWCVVVATADTASVGSSGGLFLRGIG